MGQTLTEIAKSSFKHVRVGVREYEGRRYLDVRVYFLPEGAAEWVPTRKGISVSRPEHIETLIAALQQGKELLDGHGDE